MDIFAFVKLYAGSLFNIFVILMLAVVAVSARTDGRSAYLAAKEGICGGGQYLSLTEQHIYGFTGNTDSLLYVEGIGVRIFIKVFAYLAPVVVFYCVTVLAFVCAAPGKNQNSAAFTTVDRAVIRVIRKLNKIIFIHRNIIPLEHIFYNVRFRCRHIKIRGGKMPRLL